MARGVTVRILRGQRIAYCLLNFHLLFQGFFGNILPPFSGNWPIENKNDLFKSPLPLDTKISNEVNNMHSIYVKTHSVSYNMK